jgi:hypothetical protein
MQSLRVNGPFWVGITGAILCAAGYMFTASAKGDLCKSGECTYVGANGEAQPGTCGTKKGDKKHCYCIATGDKKLDQVQSGCLAGSEK